MDTPGVLVLFGSGETALSAQRVYSELFRTLGHPVRVGVLETPLASSSTLRGLRVG